MSDHSVSLLKRPAALLIILAMMLFTGFIFSIFLHEDGHGIGAKIDGMHISTGFNKIGDYGKSPGDPGFRTVQEEGAFWGGVLGPVTTWMLAIIFTGLLYLYKKPSWGALSIGAFAVTNGFTRTLPMLSVLVFNLLGKPYMEDEVGWGIWYTLKYCRPDLATLGKDFHTLLQTYPESFLKDFSFWIPPLLSLAVSLVCLLFAYRRNYRLWGDILNHWAYRLLIAFLPIVSYIAMMPVLNWLDRFIRINW
jgi:hypothetical protein